METEDEEREEQYRREYNSYSLDQLKKEVEQHKKAIIVVEDEIEKSKKKY